MTSRLSHRAGRCGTAAALVALALNAAVAMSQARTTTVPAARAVPRVRCVNCPVDSVRGLLALKLDSLRTAWSNRRLSAAEQDVLSREITATIMALQSHLEAGIRARIAEVEVGPGSVTVTMQATARRGYIGVNLDGPSYGYPPERPDVIRFIQYPLIASVDLSSPAERGGLLRGDTLMAFNGTDVVENSISLNKLLVPNERVTITVRRTGEAREFRVVVAEAPAYVARRIVPFPGAVTVVTPMAPEAPRAAARIEVRTRARAPEAPAATTPSSWEWPVTGRMFVYSGGNVVAGARVESIGEGMAKLVGSRDGVLVVQVTPGSPAYRSGLRDGDVILTAADTPVQSARELSRVVSDAEGGEGVKLVILRERTKQDLVLRW